MSKHLGFIVVDEVTGFILEGPDHAALVCENRSSARSYCLPMTDRSVRPITYFELTKSLLDGAVFCFESEAVHTRFLRALRNDPSNKKFFPASLNNDRVRWLELPHPSCKNVPV